MKGLLPVGRVSKLFGLEGEVAVNLYDTFPGDIDHEEPLYVVIDMLAVPLFVESFRRKGRSGALMRFADIDNQTRATELLGIEIHIKEATGRSGGGERGGEGLYFEDLAGFKATITEEGGEPLSGEITGFIDSEMNPLLEVAIDGGEVLIPAVDEFITSLDEQSRTIEFTLPEGFLDLYL